MNLEIPETSDRIEEVVRGQGIAVGCQAYVAFKGEEVTFSTGMGAPGNSMTDRTMWRLYCAGKPFLSIGIACLVAQGRVLLDEPVLAYVPELTGNGKETITLRHVLSHTAGLRRPTDAEVVRHDRARRHKLVCQTPLEDGFVPGATSSYSEYAGWHLLGCIIEQVTGKNYGDFLRDALLDPLSMTDTVYGDFTREKYQEVFEHLGVFYDFSSPTPTPMLFDRAESLCLEWNPSYGCYSTAHDMGIFYRSLLASLRGEEGAIVSSETAHEWSQVGRGKMYDAVLERTCDFGLGFMVDLAAFGVGCHVSANSFGHLGNLGSTWAFCDPSNELVVSVIFNGWSEAEVARTTRIAVVDTLYEELGIADSVLSAGYRASEPMPSVRSI